MYSFEYVHMYMNACILMYSYVRNRAVLSCAGAYVSGAEGSNECPAGSVQIETEAACRNAVAATGMTFRAMVTESSLPPGCFYLISMDDVWFNANAAGYSGTRFRLLCAATTTSGAPLPLPMCAHVHRRWRCEPHTQHVMCMHRRIFICKYMQL